MERYDSTWRLGAFVRKNVMNAVAEYCMRKGFILDFSECRGWVSSVFVVHITDIPSKAEYNKMLKFFNEVFEDDE